MGDSVQVCRIVINNLVPNILRTPFQSRTPRPRASAPSAFRGRSAPYSSDQMPSNISPAKLCFSTRSLKSASSSCMRVQVSTSPLHVSGILNNDDSVVRFLLNASFDSELHRSRGLLSFSIRFVQNVDTIVTFTTDKPKRVSTVIVASSASPSNVL